MCDCREQLVEVAVGELEANSQDVSDLGAQIGLHPDDGAAIGPERRHGRVGHVGADPQDAPIPHRLREQVCSFGTRRASFVVVEPPGVEQLGVEPPHAAGSVAARASMTPMATRSGRGLGMVIGFSTR